MLKPRILVSGLIAATLAGPALAGTFTRPAGSRPVIGTVMGSGEGSQLARPQSSVTAGTNRMFALRAWLIAAFRASHGLGIVDIPEFGIGNEILGIQDGPDGVDPMGSRDKQSHPDANQLPGSGG